MPRYTDRAFRVVLHAIDPSGMPTTQESRLPRKRGAIRQVRRWVASDGAGAVRPERGAVYLVAGGSTTLIYRCRRQDGRVVVEEL